MKKFFLIYLYFIILLTGCANSPVLTAPEQPTDDIPDVVFTETTEAPPEAADDTYEASDDPALAAREAFIEHFRSGGYVSLPANYQSVYFDSGGNFVVQVSDDDYSDYDFLSELECARVETVKYTKKELEAVKDILQNILRDEHGIVVVSYWTDHKNNAVGIGIYDCYTDEEKAEIASYVEDYPVVIKYDNDYPVLN